MSRLSPALLFATLAVSLGLANAASAADTGEARYREASHAVSEALQREIYGLGEDRAALLSAAAAKSPEFGPARWHQGYVKDARRGWLRFDQYLQTPKVAQTLAKYESRRAETPDTVAGHLRLADWCADEKLSEQERAHLMRVVDLDLDHAVARGRLGFTRLAGTWISREEIARERTGEQARRAALAKWRPAIAEIREGLEQRSQQRREYAAQKLREIRDPEAIAAIEEVFGGASDEIVLPAIESLAGMSDPEAGASLARFAVQWPTLPVREVAAERLGQRPRDTYVPQLVGSMYSPVVSRFMAVNLSSGRIGYRHAFVREGESVQQVLLLDTEYRRLSLPGGSGRASAADAFAAAAGTARARELAAAEQNRLTDALNDRLAWVLAAATGENLPAQPEAWWKWWSEQNEVFVPESKPVSFIRQTREVAVVDQVSTGGGGGGSLDCLAAGTPVWTAKGLLAIETVRVGDLVLAQHAESGELAFKPVLRTTIRPRGQLIQIEAGGETLQTSGGHLFWVAGEGWRKSREIASGQVLHTASGPVHVSSVSGGSEGETYNLVVADFNTYFVGEAKVLSHDNTVRTPTRSLVPGLRGD